MIKGAIFDLDGTLFDSNPIWNDIGERYLASIGLEPKEGLKDILMTSSLQQAAQHFIDEYGVGMEAQEIMDGVNLLVEDFYFNEAPLKQGVLEFLEVLHNQGVKMCIATATDRYLVEPALERNGVSHFFSEIFTCTSVGYAKDSPHIYREALKHLGTEKELTPVFEDSFFALSTAKRDGFKVVGVRDDDEKRQGKMRETADFYLTDYRDIDSFTAFADKL